MIKQQTVNTQPAIDEMDIADFASTSQKWRNPKSKIHPMFA
jgi:hypothetical protein